MRSTSVLAFLLFATGCAPMPVDQPPVQNEPITATKDDNMAMGNPSGAVTDANVPNNYLLKKTQYVLSYNNQKGTANWVSWHLSAAWEGGTDRQNTFRADTTLPTGFTEVATSWYTNTGFDRGHLCPSADRTDTVADNDATFFMTNIVPQAPDSNRKTWAALEDYARTLVSQGDEIYTIAGPVSSGGMGTNGTQSTIHNGDVTVPEAMWKILVVLPVGTNDVARVTASTRVIAVLIPNDQSVDTHPWGDYRVSVDQIEGMTGYDFLSAVPASVQQVIEAGVDNGPTQ